MPRAAVLGTPTTVFAPVPTGTIAASAATTAARNHSVRRPKFPLAGERR